MSSGNVPRREAMEVDVLIVGAGPAGLAAALRVKQLAPERSVIVIEKGSEVGAHILSGAVLDPIGLDRLLPGWREDPSRPVHQSVQRDQFYWFTRHRAVRVPQWISPPLMSNRGNFIVSLGRVCRYMAGKAEQLGVEVYPGFAAVEVLYGGSGEVLGVATGDMGIDGAGRQKPGFSRGIELRARYTLFAEGARGSLSKTLIDRYGLQAGRDPQKFGIGVKEVWQVQPNQHQPALVQHSIGWPLDNETGGGSFLYHWGENLVALGFVVHLDYRNPWISPFEELQRFKTHPFVRGTFHGGTRVEYGARGITEGGWQSVPKLTFPGGCLIGCAAGFVNLPRIKGSHNAILSGMMAAEAAAAALAAGRARDELTDYEASWRRSAIGRDLRRVRNVKPLWSKRGTRLGVALGGLDMWTNTYGFSFFGTLSHGEPDHACLEPASNCRPIHYSKPDGNLTFDRLSSLFYSGTNHATDQPVHLRVSDEERQRRIPPVPISSETPAWGNLKYRQDDSWTKKEYILCSMPR